MGLELEFCGSDLYFSEAYNLRTAVALTFVALEELKGVMVSLKELKGVMVASTHCIEVMNSYVINNSPSASFPTTPDVVDYPFTGLVLVYLFEYNSILNVQLVIIDLL